MYQPVATFLQKRLFGKGEPARRPSFSGRPNARIPPYRGNENPDNTAPDVNNPVGGYDQAGVIEDGRSSIDKDGVNLPTRRANVGWEEFFLSE